MQKDPANRLQSINAVLREMLIKDATENLISERFRPLPQRFVERQRMADQFRQQRIMQNFAYNQARRDYVQGLRGEREAQRLERGQARWQERFNRGPAQPPQSTTPPPSSGKPVTPPSARDDWYNDPKPPPYNPDTAQPPPGSNIPPAGDSDRDGTPDNIQRPNEPARAPNYVEDPNRGPVGLMGTEGDPAFDAYRRQFNTGHPGDKAQPPQQNSQSTPSSTRKGTGQTPPSQQTGNQQPPADYVTRQEEPPPTDYVTATSNQLSRSSRPSGMQPQGGQRSSTQSTARKP